MSAQILFLEKNVADFSRSQVVASASQGNEYANLTLNRSNLTAWVTTGSVDADNTTYTVDFGEQRYIDCLLLVKHNFKNYSAEYWNGSAWTAFPTAISVTNNTAETTFHEFAEVFASQIRITITGTMIANADKFLHQFIATLKIGRFNGWPVIRNVRHERNRTVTKMLSGKYSVFENVGGFRCTLSVACWKDTQDLDLVERLYRAAEGFHVWLSGGDESQFSSAREGYRLEDVYLMRCVNDYQPSFYKGLYDSGLAITMDLSEVID